MRFTPWRRDQTACSVACHNKVVRRGPGKFRLYHMAPKTKGRGRAFTVTYEGLEITGFFLTVTGWIIWPKMAGKHILRMLKGPRQRVSQSLKKQIAEYERNEEDLGQVEQPKLEKPDKPALPARYAFRCASCGQPCAYTIGPGRARCESCGLEQDSRTLSLCKWSEDKQDWIGK